jgi:hypothetical protein
MGAMRNIQAVGQNNQHRALLRQCNTSRPIKMPTAQLLSTPSHSHDLKIRRLIRTQLLASGAGAQTLTIQLGDVLTAVRRELAVTASAGGENVAIHGVRVYAQTCQATSATNASSGPVELGVSVYDTEEGAVGSLISQFVDESSLSGVANVRFVFPVNNRPTFTRSSVLTADFLRIDLNSAIVGTTLNFPITVDYDVDYTRVNNTPLVLSRTLYFNGAKQDTSVKNDGNLSIKPADCEQGVAIDVQSDGCCSIV